MASGGPDWKSRICSFSVCVSCGATSPRNHPSILTDAVLNKMIKFCEELFICEGLKVCILQPGRKFLFWLGRNDEWGSKLSQ
jgi:hypothetical protein